jgi:hypothetical protein
MYVLIFTYSSNESTSARSELAQVDTVVVVTTARIDGNTIGIHAASNGIVGSSEILGEDPVDRLTGSLLLLLAGSGFLDPLRLLILFGVVLAELVDSECTSTDDSKTSEDSTGDLINE